MIINIDKCPFHINENEFNRIIHKEYNNLKIFNDVGICERLVSLFIELRRCFTNNYENNMVFIDTTKGGFLPIKSSVYFNKIFLFNTLLDNVENIEKNICNYKITNILKIDNISKLEVNENNVIFTEEVTDPMFSLLNSINNKILITKFNNKLINKWFRYAYPLKNTDFYIYLNDEYNIAFLENFKYYLEDDNSILNYDNLINLCIMVKNAGPQFEDMLKENLPLIDRWTILDTGSTDDTIEIINKVLVGKKQGNLYQEPFINFRDSRNRLLELAGTQCKFNLILDDTYIVKGDLRLFLNEVRGDQYASSFSLFIKSNDVNYSSNRITKSVYGLKYIYKIHEVIEEKNNIIVMVPEKNAYIFDGRFEYMEDRTMKRKNLDLKLLYEEVEDNPMEPRTYYYLGQTYNLLEDYENAYKYFLKRAEFTNAGFIQERIDAVFEAARIANFKLNKPWSECLQLYEKCYKIDESRPDALYFIGIHYHLEGNNKKAYAYFKQGFQLGYPEHCQYGLKPTISYHFLPKFLTRICYQIEDYKLGEESANFFLLNNKPDSADYNEVLSWYNIYKKLNIYTGPKKPVMPEKPIFCFVADGGFNQWSGSNILTSGVGGSETYIIEMAKWIQKSGLFQTYVFCNTPDNTTEIYEGTIYKPLIEYYEFVNTTYIQHCIVSRFSEYLPVSFKGWTENVYLVVHDLTPSGIVIPIDNKLKNIFCLTEWHVEYFTNIFPSLKHLTVPFYYGCSFGENTIVNQIVNQMNKVPYKFIYSSFPNRGLLQLLQMWPKIYSFQPKATLHIYADVNNKWSNDVEPDKMNAIKQLLESYSKMENGLGIFYHGWVNKSELRDAWTTADIWFYPCTFMETFCLTALEAACSKTFVITNDLAALQNTVGDRGIIIKGDPTSEEWQNVAINELFKYMTGEIYPIKNSLIEKNYLWASSLTWENQAKKILNTYILPNKLEYKGMYNWTNDKPNGSKEIFLGMIQYFKLNNYKAKIGERINILEIGSYTGISLINIIKNIPNSYGTAIDTWSNYDEDFLLNNVVEFEVEKSFYKNIKIEGVDDKIVAIKKISKDALIEFIKKKQIFDFIYVDGSHMLLDCYSDLILSWEILDKGGMLVIDDYLSKKESLLESPFEAVNRFLKLYEGKYKILNKDYRKDCRVFLEKTL